MTLRINTRSTGEGFTLLELLVVLSVLGVVLALTPINLGQALPGQQLHAAAINIADAMRLAHMKSVESGNPQISALGTAKLPPNVHIDVAEPGGTNSITFYPDGSSSGGDVVVSRSGQAYRISVDWITGAVVLHD